MGKVYNEKERMFRFFSKILLILNMDIASKKLELLDWLLHVNDTKLLAKIESLKQLTVTQEKQQPIFGRLKGKIILAPDFDAPLEDFKEYSE